MRAAAFKRTMASAGVSIFLATCRTSDIPRELDLPVSREQQSLAIGEAKRFRERFNKGACQAIYDQASEFFRHQLQQDWMSRCAELRGRLGLWRSSDIRSAITCGSRVICLDGTAAFERGSYDLELAWTFRDGRPRLFWWILDAGGHRTQIPPFPDPRNLMDPPLRLKRKSKPARNVQSAPRSVIFHTDDSTGALPGFFTP